MKKKLLTAQGSGEMGKVLLYVIMPVAIIRSYIQEFSMEYLYGFLISFAAAALALILAMAGAPPSVSSGRLFPTRDLSGFPWYR